MKQTKQVELPEYYLQAREKMFDQVWDILKDVRYKKLTIDNAYRLIRKVVAYTEDVLSKESAQAQQEAVEKEMRKRCLLFGCVFGIPQIDKEPRKECMFCGEPGYIDQDEWVNISPLELMQKVVNKLVEKYKTPEAIKKYLESLQQEQE